jgi:hypothetical protein
MSDRSGGDHNCHQSGRGVLLIDQEFRHQLNDEQNVSLEMIGSDSLLHLTIHPVMIAELSR